MTRSSDTDILLVEDNPDDVLLTIRALKKNGIANSVTVAADGVEAVDILFGADGAGGSGSRLPGLILLDLKLPKVSGLEVLERIRADERTRYVPVVVLTTSDEDRDIVESYKLGANSYVRKPLEFMEFIGAIQQLGMYWLILNRAPSTTAEGG